MKYEIIRKGPRHFQSEAHDPYHRSFNTSQKMFNYIYNRYGDFWEHQTNKTTSIDLRSKSVKFGDLGLQVLHDTELFETPNLISWQGEAELALIKKKGFSYTPAESEGWGIVEEGSEELRIENDQGERINIHNLETLINLPGIEYVKVQYNRRKNTRKIEYEERTFQSDISDYTLESGETQCRYGLIGIWSGLPDIVRKGIGPVWTIKWPDSE